MDTIAGYYNYVSFHPAGVVGNLYDKTSYGTLLLNADKTWSILHESDLKTTGSTVAPTFQGTAQDMGNGALVLSVNGAKFAHLMIRQEESGEHFAVVDLVDKAVKGIAFGARQNPVTNDELQGDYEVVLTEQFAPTKGTLKGNQLTVAEDNDQLSYTMKLNHPWPGLISARSQSLPDGTYYEFFAVTSKRSKAVYGVLQYMNPSNNAIDGRGTQAFVGLKQ